MALDSATALGEMIGKLSADQDNIKENISPDDTETQEQVYAQEEVVSEGDIQVIRKNYADDSFVIDHPVLGYINSATLKIDGGYGGALGGFTFPGSFPLVLNEGTTSTSLLFSATF